MNDKLFNNYWKNLDKYVLLKKSYCFQNKILDINDCWWLFKGDAFSADEDINAYWFDKISYSFIQYKDITKSDERFIKCIEFDTGELYKFYEDKINLPEITAYFENSTDLEEKYLKFRKFVDWNMIDITYDRYIAVSQQLIKWCIQNHIEYSFKRIPPPDNYVFKNDSYKTRKWQIPN